jgi:hypothetical protein
LRALLHHSVAQHNQRHVATALYTWRLRLRQRQHHSAGMTRASSHHIFRVQAKGFIEWRRLVRWLKQRRAHDQVSPFCRFDAVVPF